MLLNGKHNVGSPFAIEVRPSVLTLPTECFVRFQTKNGTYGWSCRNLLTFMPYASNMVEVVNVVVADD